MALLMFETHVIEHNESIEWHEEGLLFFDFYSDVAIKIETWPSRRNAAERYVPGLLTQKVAPGGIKFDVGISIINDDPGGSPATVTLWWIADE